MCGLVQGDLLLLVRLWVSLLRLVGLLRRVLLLLVLLRLLLRVLVLLLLLGLLLLLLLGVLGPRLGADDGGRGLGTRYGS